MERKALIVGINHYSKINKLYGCVNDAQEVKNVLERNGDETLNFDINLLIADNEERAVSRKVLKNSVEELFSGDEEVALFYFAGHGHIEATGGYLCASDCETGDDGLGLYDVLILASQSKVKNKIIVLDSCHSGIAGSPPSLKPMTLISEGTTILTASTAEQYASEKDGSGVFTSLFVDALRGPAANLVGDITPGSVYAHIDQSLGSWAGQRPMFKTNVKSFVSLRKVNPPISLSDLKKITQLFPEPGFEYSLDPSFERTSDQAKIENVSIFEILQKYRDVSLLKPVGAVHMYDAAMESKSCRLTITGEHWRKLVSEKRI